MSLTGINDLPALILATLIFLAIPGPGTIKLLASVGEKNGGYRAGLWSTFGLITGDTVWILLALAGVSALAAANPLTFDILRYVGAAYLIWIGFELIRRARETGPAEIHPSLAGRGPRQWFTESMLVSLSNPKVIGFYVAFFPLFIDPPSFDGWPTYVRMMLVVITLAWLYCLWLIFAAAMARRAFARPSRAPRWLKRLAGACLIGFAVKFAIQK